MNPSAPTQKLTPMMEQYRSIKKTLPPDTILFFRLGDFYEMFFEDALRASEILDITLTGREAGEAGRVPMCGIPYHSYQGYVKTLLDHNLKVAVCDQMGDPKLAKGLVERKITRILSRATNLEDENKSKRAEYMAAAAVEGEEAAVAYLELSTGEFYVREMKKEKLVHELSLLNPSELILTKTQAADEPFMDFVKTVLNATVTSYEDWIFEEQEAVTRIQETFRLAAFRHLPIAGRPRALSAAGAVLYYLRDHFHTSLDHLRLPQILESSEFMVLDRQTQRSLELVSNLSGERNGVTLLSTIDQTLTSMGARTLFHWLTHPLLNIGKIQARQDGVRELSGHSERLHSIRGFLQGVRDMERTVSRLNCGVANARDLVNLKLFLKRVPEFQALLACSQTEALKKIYGSLNPLPHLLELIEKAVVEEPPLGVRDGNLIRDGYSAELDELRSISRKGKQWLVEFEKKEIERTGIKSLKIRYNQVFGYLIEISNSYLKSAPPEYLRKQTLANGERFILPELKAWDEKISGAQDKIIALEYVLFNEIRGKVLEDLEPLQTMAKAVGELDVLASFALTALQKRWTPPLLSDSDTLVIRGGRHPVVESMLPTGQFVENDTLLDGRENQLIVLTGPNMAGKSTYIRQAAQIVLLAQIGSYVPTASAQIGIVDRIFTRIGAADDLARGESTFMVEMLETAHILQSATNRSLLILDEVGRGTSTFDGVSIAWAICEFLAKGKVRPRTLFATHYHELTQLEEHFPSIKNYNITVRETKNGIVFLRRVARGSADRSYGIHVARLAGIPAEITQRANQILKVLESENTQATRILENILGKKPSASQAAQPTLFDLGEERRARENGFDKILETLLELNLNTLTPIEALNKLQEMQKRLKEAEM